MKYIKGMLPSDNCSKLHARAGSLLVDVFGYNCNAAQELPVKLIDPDYPSGRERFDWVILDYKLVVEAHGQQHFDLHRDDTIADLQARQIRDESKREIAEGNGYTYLTLTDEDTDEMFTEKLIQVRDTFTDKPGTLTFPGGKKKKWIAQTRRTRNKDQKIKDTDAVVAAKEFARDARRKHAREKYKVYKEWKNSQTQK